jgi:NADPH:quinone reductase-like Zn-dependent oxidoreductase
MSDDDERERESFWMQHVEIPVPVVKKDYVLIRVEAVSINPHDWKIQDGYVRHVLPPRFPHTPGTDVAGEVVGLGLGVTTFSLGDKVVSCLGTVCLLFLFAPIQTKWTCRVKAPGWGHSQNKRPRTRC